MLPMGRFRMLNEARKEFDWIKKAKLTKSEKLNELVDLRNYLKETYQFTEAKRKKFASLQEDITILINEIDKYWWELFTKGKAG